MPFTSSGGGGSSQRARAGSFGAPAGARFGGRAALRARLLGWGVLGPEELAETELVLHELADGLVRERIRELVGRVRVRDLDALVQVVCRDQVSLGQRIEARVLEMPDRPGL